MTSGAGQANSNLLYLWYDGSLGWRKDGWRMGGLVKSVENGGVGANMVDERW